MQTDQTKLLALALIEIRTLLAEYLGNDVDAPMSVRVAAHMAYALHNETEAACSNADFRIDYAIQKIAAIDQILRSKDGAALLSRFTPKRKSFRKTLPPNDYFWP
ncbi:hypothetical protein F475_04110 [Pseudomonas sp. URMO17WK12:I6]|jgi:hypothetical protein|uniref:hypothetical protein n=1 Tax=Pseudomonas sp. URMO17WK12:I6 TaxID=1261629 RepID=UPI000DAEF52F|nr:hypothetical protein [Pseudomonas sp. URMO17WK12:I6]PZW57481.1 hypothetical protein F475_04110 [Pseudomonas sp. URMO17WK12:I6]